MTEWKYLPILKWKQGERIALRNLKGDQWDGVVPLIELQPIAAAPNFPSLQAALPDYLDKIAKDLGKALPESTACAIDTRYVSTGYPKQAQLLQAVSLRLGKLTDRQILPVITSALVQSEAAQLERIAERFDECIVRIDAPSVDVTQVQPIIELVKDAFKKGTVHVVVDQFSLVGKDSKVMATTIRPTYATDDQNDKQEAEADTFALDAMGGDAVESEVGKWAAQMAPVELAVKARMAAKVFKIEPGHFILRHAFVNRRWPDAITALRFLSEDLNPEAALLSEFERRLDMSAVSDDMQNLVTQITGWSGAHL